MEANRLNLLLGIAFLLIVCCHRNELEISIERQELLYDSSEHKGNTYEVRMTTTIGFINKSENIIDLKKRGLDTLLLKTNTTKYYLYSDILKDKKILNPKESVNISYKSNFIWKSDRSNNDSLEDVIRNSKLYSLNGKNKILKNKSFDVDSRVKIYVKETIIDELGDTIKVFGN